MATMIKVEISHVVVKSEPTEEVVKSEPTEEVVKYEPNEEVVKYEPNEEVVNYEPTEEVVNYEPTEEVVKSEPTEAVKLEPTEEVDETKNACVGNLIKQGTHSAESCDDKKLFEPYYIIQVKGKETVNLFSDIIKLIRDNPGYSRLQYRLLNVPISPVRYAQYLEISRQYCDNAIPMPEAVLTVSKDGIAKFRVMSQLFETTNILNEESQLDRDVMQKTVLAKFATMYRRCLGLTEEFKKKFDWPKVPVQPFLQLEEIGEPWSMVRSKKCERWFLARRRTQLACASCIKCSGRYRRTMKKDLEADKDKRLVAQSHYPICLLNREQQMIRHKNKSAEVVSLRGRYKRLHQYFLSVNEEGSKECDEVKEFVKRVLDKKLKLFNSSPNGNLLIHCPSENDNLDEGESLTSDSASEHELDTEYMDFVDVDDQTLALPSPEEVINSVPSDSNENTVGPLPESSQVAPISRRKSGVSGRKKNAKKELNVNQ